MHRSPYEAKIHYKKRLSRLGKCTNGWVCGVYYSERKGRYIRLSRGSRSKWLKKCSNRKIRRFKGDLPKNVHKLFDYWWCLW